MTGSAASNLTLSSTSAVSGSQITISPTGTAELPINNSYVYVTTTPTSAVTYSDSSWKFNMPAGNTTVSGVFKQDPELSFSTAAGSAYIDAPEHNSLPTLSYVGAFDGSFLYSMTGTSYAYDFAFASDGTPSVTDGTDAYTYINQGNSISGNVVVTAYASNVYYGDTATYELTMSKYN